jgi:hypothetical protein
MQLQDTAAAAAISRSAQLRKRKREPKLLRCQTILNAAHQAKPVNPAASKQRNLRGVAHKVNGKPKQQALVVRQANNAVDTSNTDLDMWDGQESGAAAGKTRKGLFTPGHFLSFLVGWILIGIGIGIGLDYEVPSNQ